MDGVERLLVDGQVLTFGFLERDGEDVGRALVAQVGQAGAAVGDPGGDLDEQGRVGAGGGGVVLATRAYCGSPQGQPSGADTTWMLPPW